MRASDSDRHQIYDELSKAFEEGRIDHSELSERMDAAASGKTYGELYKVIEDLPSAAGFRWGTAGAPAPYDRSTPPTPAGPLYRAGRVLSSLPFPVRVLVWVGLWTVGSSFAMSLFGIAVAGSFMMAGVLGRFLPIILVSLLVVRIRRRSSRRGRRY